MQQALTSAGSRGRGGRGGRGRQGGRGRGRGRAPGDGEPEVDNVDAGIFPEIFVAEMVQIAAFPMMSRISLQIIGR